jgi:hypothetical protein
METSHEEADIILVQQMVHLATNHDQHEHCIKIIADDTDVFILLLYYYRLHDISCKVVMQASSSNRAMIDIGATTSKHKDIIPNILGLHALTGCDTVACMYGIGKSTALKTLSKGYDLQNLGNKEADFEEVFQEATAFIGACYGYQGTENMSQIRYQAWLTKTGRRNVMSTPKLKSLPPTKESFLMNVKRAHNQAIVWMSTMAPNPPNLDATEFGWRKDEASKSLLPITVGQGIDLAPPEILKMIRCGCAAEDACSSSRCGCSSAQLPCTPFCNCMKSENISCHNRLSKHASQEHDEEDNDDQDHEDHEEV